MNSYAIFALGLLGLPGCAVDLVGPAADPGRYALIEPEVVVVSSTLERLALRSAPADHAPHRVGLHLGHGLVVDARGQLGAIPQMVAPTGDGLAVAEPDFVEIGGVVQNTLEPTAAGYDLVGPAGVDRAFLFDGESWEIQPFVPLVLHPRVDFDGERTRIRWADGPTVILQSQGDHLLLQQVGIRRRTEIRYAPDGSLYEVEPPAADQARRVVVSDDDETWITWPLTRIVYRRSVDEDGAERLERRQGLVRTVTTVGPDGWVDGRTVKTTVAFEGGSAPTLP